MDFHTLTELITLLGPSAVLVGVIFYVYHKISTAILENRSRGDNIEQKVDQVSTDVKCLNKDMIELKIEQARIGARDEAYQAYLELEQKEAAASGRSISAV